MDEIVSTLHDDKVKQPIYLIELSKSELKRFKNNTIHLSGLIDHPIATNKKKILPLYSKVNYGSNINKRKRKEKW